MEVGPQETDFDSLVRDVEAAGIPMPLAPDAQTDRLHLSGLGIFRAVPVSPQLPVVDEPGPAASHRAQSPIQQARASLRKRGVVSMFYYAR